MDTIEQIQYNKMTKTSVNKLIMALSVPTIISMLVTSAYNIADTYFVSQIGTDASAAVGVVFSLMSFIQAFGFTIGMGSGSYISISLGKKDNETARKYASSGFFFALATGLVISVAGLILIKPFMKLLGSTSTILPYSCDYARYILIGVPVMCGCFVMNNILRSEGKAFFSMIGLGVSALLNIVLDPIMITKMNMGIKGAGFSTLISQCVSFIVLGAVFVRGKSVVSISYKSVSRHLSTYTSIIKVGMPTLCRQGLASVASTILVRRAAIYGNAAIAALSIATRIYLMLRSFVIGLGQGLQPVAGYNFGAKKYDRVKKGFVFTVIVSTVVCIVVGIFIFIKAEWIMSMFRKNDADVIRIGAKAVRMLCVVMPVLGFSTVINQLLQCLRMSKSATFLASCRQGVFFLPLIYILSFTAGLTGIQLVQPLSDFLTFVISIPFTVWLYRKVLVTQ